MVHFVWGKCLFAQGVRRTSEEHLGQLHGPREAGWLHGGGDSYRSTGIVQMREAAINYQAQTIQYPHTQPNL